MDKKNLSLHNIFLHLDQIKGEKVEVVCKNFLPLVKGGGYNLLSGRGGVGKSIIALRSMVHYLKVNPKDKGIAYFTEDDKEEVETRLNAICDTEHRMTRLEIAALKNRCRFITTENDPMWKFAKKGLADYEKTDEFFNFLKYMIEEDIKFLILDPLKAFHTLSENDNTDMDFVVRDTMKMLTTKTGACLLILHHSSKGEGGARGASTISDSGRVSYSIDRVHKKTKDGKLIPDDDYEGMARLVVEKDNKNIFKYCRILDEKRMFKIFPQKIEVETTEYQMETPYV